MDKSTGFFGRTWRGKLNPNPWDAVYAQAAAYRERFERDGTALTREEAAALYRLVAPLRDPDPDEAERFAAVRRFSRLSPHIGRTYFNVERISGSGLLVAFEAEHAGEPPNTGRTYFNPKAISDMLTAFEMLAALEAKHAGEPPIEILGILGEPWERYFALKFLQLLVSEDLISYPDATIRKLIARAVPILRERPVTRPPGRHNPAVNDRRDMFIRGCIAVLEGRGLPVTSSGGDSLAGALAEAFGVSEHTIRKVWEGWQLREPCVNDEAPAGLRMCESLIRRRREYFAVSVPCADCGRAGRVPKFRADKGGSRLCLSCRPTSGEW